MKPNGLLKIVSILIIIFSVIAIVLTLFGSTFLGSLTSMAYDLLGIEGAVGAGLLTGSLLFVWFVAGNVLDLVAGILGVKGKFTGCKVLGIILLVFAVIGAVMNISMFDAAATIIVVSIVRLILPVLYVWGAFKGPEA